MDATGKKLTRKGSSLAWRCVYADAPAIVPAAPPVVSTKRTSPQHAMPAPQRTPKRVRIQGVDYFRTKHGNLILASLVPTQKRHGNKTWALRVYSN
jgi:hypothetical protein